MKGRERRFETRGPPLTGAQAVPPDRGSCISAVRGISSGPCGRRGLEGRFHLLNMTMSSGSCRGWRRLGWTLRYKCAVVSVSVRGTHDTHTFPEAEAAALAALLDLSFGGSPLPSHEGVP